MHRTNRVLAAVCVAWAFSNSHLTAIEPAIVPDAKTGEGASFPFSPPRDQATPMITLAFADPGRAARQPVAELSIFADGKVVAAAEPFSEERLTAYLPQNEWLKIQRLLFVENDLLACRSDGLERAICELRRQRRRPQPGPDSAVTIFRIRGESFAWTVHCHAVGLTATQLPDLPEIQKLYACEQCLLNVMHVVRAGGYDQVNRALQTVNARLEREHPGAGPLSSGDLNLVDCRPDGTRYLQFSRLPCAASGGSFDTGNLRMPEEFLIVSVYERPGLPLEISIIGDAHTP